MLFTLLVVGGLLWAQSVGAVPGAAPASPDVASTGTMAYQGRLANPAGDPLTGTYSMIFRLYAASTGGAPLWEEQWTGPNSAQVSDGLFNVMLGSLTPIPEGVMTGNTSLWLGITVGSDDEMAPRVQLGSVPFAVQAITVPDASVTTAKIADGAVTAAKLDPAIDFAPPYLFGGAYTVNPHTGGCQKVNPFTGGCTCPATYSYMLVALVPHGTDGYNCNGVNCVTNVCYK